MSKASYHHGHLREALLQAAQSQIATEGSQALNLSKLARQLGVSQPAVYRHFANKQALIVSLVEHGFHVLIQRLAMAADAVTLASESADALLAGIEAVARAYVDFVLEHRELARLMFSVKERATEPTLYQISKQAAAPLFQLTEAGQRHYGLKTDSPEQAVRLMWATIHGLSVLLMDEQLPYVTQTPGQLAVHTAAIAQLLYSGLFAIPADAALPNPSKPVTIKESSCQGPQCG